MSNDLPDYILVSLLWLATLLPVFLAYGVKYSRGGFKVFMWVLWLLAACAGFGFWHYAEDVRPGIDGGWGWAAVLINIWWFMEAADSRFLARKKKKKTVVKTEAAPSVAQTVDAESEVEVDQNSASHPGTVNLRKK